MDLAWIKGAVDNVVIVSRAIRLLAAVSPLNENGSKSSAWG